MRKLKLIVLFILNFALASHLAFAQAPSAAQVANKKDGKAKSEAHPTASKSVKNSESIRSKATLVEHALAPQELSIAERVHVGQLPCELGTSVLMTADANAPGYFNLQGKGYKYRMRPIATTTGAIRLEDEKAGTVWLQLSNKSMLMDQKNGRRLADECAHPDQVAVANDMKVNPPPALIDVRDIVSTIKR